MVAFFSGVIEMWLPFFLSGVVGKRLRFFQWSGRKVVLCGCLNFQWSVRIGCCCFSVLAVYFQWYAPGFTVY